MKLLKNQLHSRTRAKLMQKIFKKRTTFPDLQKETNFIELQPDFFSGVDLPQTDGTPDVPESGVEGVRIGRIRTKGMADLQQIT